MRKINTLLIILISVNITLFAQNRVIKHKIDNNYLIDGILRANMVGTYDYNYYEDARGEYVKHGNFKMSGNDVMEIVKFRKKIIIKRFAKACNDIGFDIDRYNNNLINELPYSMHQKLFLNSVINNMKPINIGFVIYNNSPQAPL